MNPLAAVRARAAIRSRRRRRLRARLLATYTLAGGDECATARRDHLLAAIHAGRVRAGAR